MYALPDSASRRPAVLLVHGGGWRGGDKERAAADYGILLGRAGYLCVASEYRLVGESPWPAQIHDVKAAIRWMPANAERARHRPRPHCARRGTPPALTWSCLRLGTPNVAEYEGDGGNPGVDTTVSAVIAIYPPNPISLRRPRQHGAVPIDALSDHPTAELAESASPVNLVSPEFPPTMLVHGTADTTVPVSASFLMYESLTKHQVPTDLHVYAPSSPTRSDVDPRLTAGAVPI